MPACCVREWDNLFLIRNVLIPTQILIFREKKKKEKKAVNCEIHLGIVQWRQRAFLSLSEFLIEIKHIGVLHAAQSLCRSLFSLLSCLH